MSNNDNDNNVNNNKNANYIRHQIRSLELEKQRDEAELEAKLAQQELLERSLHNSSQYLHNNNNNNNNSSHYLSSIHDHNLNDTIVSNNDYNYNTSFRSDYNKLNNNNNNNNDKTNTLNIEFHSAPVSPRFNNNNNNNNNSSNNNKSIDNSNAEIKIQQLLDLRAEEESLHRKQIKELHIYYGSKLKESRELLNKETEKLLKARELALLRGTNLSSETILKSKLQAEALERSRLLTTNRQLREKAISIKNDYQDLINALREENSLLLQSYEKLKQQKSSSSKVELLIHKLIPLLHEVENNIPQLDTKSQTNLQNMLDKFLDFTHELTSDTATKPFKPQSSIYSSPQNRLSPHSIVSSNRKSNLSPNHHKSTKILVTSPGRYVKHPHHDHPTNFQRYDSPTRSSAIKTKKSKVSNKNKRKVNKKKKKKRTVRRSLYQAYN